jgi:predicted dinucleotide-binding enzyme
VGSTVGQGTGAHGERVLVARQGEKESSALIDRAFNPDVAAMTVNDAIDDR